MHIVHSGLIIDGELSRDKALEILGTERINDIEYAKHRNGIFPLISKKFHSASLKILLKTLQTIGIKSRGSSGCAGAVGLIFES